MYVTYIQHIIYIVLQNSYRLSVIYSIKDIAYPMGRAINNAYSRCMVAIDSVLVLFFCNCAQ